MNNKIKNIGLQNYSEVEERKVSTLLTGNKKFDKFFSFIGGVPWGTMNYITGSSGAGKTTISAMLQAIIEDVKSAMYQRESLASQVRDRNKNIGFHKNCFIADVKSCPHMEDFMDEVSRLGIKILFLDSLQIIAKDYSEEMGSDRAAEEHVYMMLLDWVTKTGGIVFLIGHVNKDDQFKGDNGIIQMMDSHMEFIYNKKTNERVMRFGQKNREGSNAPDNILFYDFVGNGKGVNLYTASEWAIIHKKSNIVQYLAPYMQDYIDAFKDHKSFKKLKKELMSYQHQLLQNENVSQYELLGKMFTKIGELCEEHKMM